MTVDINKIDRHLKSIIDNEALAFAMYTVENRAIPHLIDGLKPVQRFFLYSTLMNARTAYTKVAAIAGRVSELGYHHGEGSAADSGQLMANTWNNNLPIIQGRGNFGSRMVHSMGAPRYTFCKLHDNFFDVFKDTDLAPEHVDKEHLPPAFYLPTIPFILLNGVKGIATGFATDILPHCPEDVVRCVKEYLATGDIKKEPKIKFPEFHGKIIYGDKMFIEGTYTFNGKTKLEITEIPYKYDRETYVAILDALEDAGTIVRYDDKCGKDNFNFEVTLKRDFFTGQKESEYHEIFMKTFKLRQGISQNITCIDENRKLRYYEKASRLIKDFVDYRMKFTQKRIDSKIPVLERKFALAEAKTVFIEKVIDEVIVLRGKTRAAAIKEIETHPELMMFSEELISMNIYHMTKDEIAKLKKQAKEIKQELQYWKKTSSQVEYLKDLESLA